MIGTIQAVLDGEVAPNYAAYPPEARPYLEEAFARWNELWRVLLEEGLDIAAAHALSSAWRLFRGEHVRASDLLPTAPSAVRALFPSSPANREWWFTEDGWRKGLLQGRETTCLSL